MDGIIEQKHTVLDTMNRKKATEESYKWAGNMIPRNDHREAKNMKNYAKAFIWRQANQGL